MNSSKSVASLGEMVCALISSGMTEKAVADSVGTTQPTIHRIKAGATCNYELGKRIEDFYQRHVADSQENSAA